MWGTATYYRAADPDAPGKPVGFFGPGPTSPFWHAIAREYIERWVHHSISNSVNFLKAVPTDGRTLIAVARIEDRTDDLMVVSSHVRDASGETVATSQGLVMLRPVADGTAHTRSERMLLTVLFTDLVGSTAQARALGDEQWHELLEEHNTLVRSKLTLFKGREVKTTGD